VSIAGEYISERNFVIIMRKFAERIQTTSTFAFDQETDMSVSILRLKREMMKTSQRCSGARSTENICTHTKLKGGETTTGKSEQCSVTTTGCHLNAMSMRKRKVLLFCKQARQKDTICALNSIYSFLHLLQHENTIF